MRLLVALTVGLVLAAAPVVGEQAKAPSLDEVDALRIEKLGLELALMQEKADRLRVELQILQRDFPAKARERDAAVEAAATKAGVKLDEGWRPVLDEKVWRKVPQK